MTEFTKLVAVQMSYHVYAAKERANVFLVVSIYSASGDARASAVITLA